MSMRPSLIARLFNAVFRAVNRVVPWHRLPTWVGIANLGALRSELRQHNLHDTTGAPFPTGPQPEDAPEEVRNYRTMDGTYNDLRQPRMGCTGQRFGRNFPIERTWPDPEPALLTPSPRKVSRDLLARTEFQPATILNVLAAAWIQFQTHDWFSHGDPKAGDEFEVHLDPKDDWHEHPMRIRRTIADQERTAADEGRPPTFRNHVSHWWDGSGIYGSDLETSRRLRTFEDGKMKVFNGRLPQDDSGKIETGFNDNWWLGLALLHTLFTREHNAICDALRKEQPSWSDERLFQTARLINAALMAKIHTVEWTPAILPNPALQIGMAANWWGIVGKKFHDRHGRVSDSEAISGIPGSPLDHHGCNFTLTEEFSSVYRLHPLIPDDYDFYSIAKGKHIRGAVFDDLAFTEAQRILDGDINFEDAFYSFGIAHPGAVRLHNFPNALRNIKIPTQDNVRLDLAAVDIMRDRERGIPRYNDFREMLRMPRFKSFDQMTSNPQWARELQEVYDGDVNRVDSMVGMYSEDLPKGFGFSDTAFRVFILMASRRLKSDRFFTDYFREDIYTPLGMNWINNTTMIDVLLRHYPGLAPTLAGSKNAFAPWKPVAAHTPAPSRTPAMAAAR